MEDRTAKLESAGYSRNGDMWERTEDGLTLKVTLKSDGFEIEGQVKAGSVTRKISISAPSWRNFRRTEDAVREALEGSLGDTLDEVLVAGVDIGRAFDGMDRAFDRTFGTRRPGRCAPRVRTFAYEAMDQSGGEVKDEMEATSTEDALAKIRNLGYFPTRIREKGPFDVEISASRNMRADLLGNLFSRLRHRGVAGWCSSHARTLLLAGIVVLGVILILT